MLDEMDELVKQQEILLNTHCELPCDSFKELAKKIQQKEINFKMINITIPKRYAI